MATIHFGPNEYELVPNSHVAESGGFADIQIAADEVSFNALETVVSDAANLQDIVVTEDEYVRHYTGYTKLIDMRKVYDIIYNTRYEEVIVEPEHFDPETGEVIPAVIEIVPVEERMDMIYIRLSKKGIEEQVEQNTANIEFIAIMSDIEL